MYEKMYKFRNVLVVFEFLLLGIATYYGRLSFAYQLGLTISLTVSAIILCLIGRKTKKYLLYYVSAVLNTIATGITMSIYYTDQIAFDVYKAVFIIGASIVIYLICSFLLTKYNKSKKIKTSVIVFMSAILIASIIEWIIEKDKFLYSYIFLFSFFNLLLLIAYLEKMKKNEYIKTFTLLHFALFFIVVIIIAIVASEGEGIEDLAEGLVIGGKDKKAKVKNSAQKLINKYENKRL